MPVLTLPDCGVFLQAGFCLGATLRSWVLQLMEQPSQAAMVTTSCSWETGRSQVLRPVSPLAAPALLCPACGQGWEGLHSGLANRCSVYDLAQLMGIAIGALLALALVGVTVFFMYRKFSQFGEYLASASSLQARRVGRSGWPAMCSELPGAALKPVVAFVGNCWLLQAEAKHVGSTEFESIWHFLSSRFRAWLQ